MQNVIQPNARRDIVAGAIFIAIALAFGLEATNYPLGRALRMGPGFIPLTLAVLLVALGVMVIVAGLRKEGVNEIGGVPWKAILLVLLSLGIFGYAGTRLGLVPTAFLCSFVISLASSRNGVAAAAAIGALLSALSWLVFKVGLSVSLPSIGPILSF